MFLFDEPTVGVDVGAKAEVYELMKALVSAGAAIVLVSSELPEVMNLSHRLYVMHRSRMVAELTGAGINEPEVLSLLLWRDVAREDGVARARLTGSGMAREATTKTAPASAFDGIYRAYGVVGFLPTMLVAFIILLAIFVPHFLACRISSTCCAAHPIWLLWRPGRCWFYRRRLRSFGGRGGRAHQRRQRHGHGRAGTSFPLSRASSLLLASPPAWLRPGGRPGQRALRRLSSDFPFHGDARHHVDRYRRGAAADQRHSGLWHAEGLCRRFRSGLWLELPTAVYLAITVVARSG